MESLSKVNTNKNIIFHFPWDVDQDETSAGFNRMSNLLKAFESIGCEVDVIYGSGADRLKKIKSVKNKIKNNEKYDLLYSESSTFPTMFTDGFKESVSFPFLDFRFFAYCKKNKIPIGLFYRDIYWKFPYLIDVNHTNKKPVMIFFYLFDLLMYKKYVDILYLPNLKMQKYLPFHFSKIKSLPPGCNDNGPRQRKNKNGLNIVYLGGIGELYKIHKLIKVVGNFLDINLTINCRKFDWEKNKDDYKDLIKENIKIGHFSGETLDKILKQTDLATIFLETHKYREIVMPQKLFEYIGFYKPIITTQGTAVSDFVEQYDIGWSLPYQESSLTDLLKTIQDNPSLINVKQKNISKIVKNNTWIARANQIINDLSIKSDKKT